MGSLTRSQIVDEGMLQAGRSDLEARMNVYLNAWLRSQYTAWDWPFLHRRKTGLALTAGLTTVSVGNGSSSITAEIKKILDPIYVYDSTYSTKCRARIRQLTGGDVYFDETVNNPATWRGLPTQFKVKADTALWGKWSLIPMPFPDRDYLATFDYIETPANIDVSSSGDSTIPIYPNDRTMIQAVVSETCKYAYGSDSPQFAAAMDLLSSMVVDDRMKFGQVHGTNDLVQLDSDTFR